MISQLQLTNFQGHQDSTFDLTPGINVVTGQSDSGKSSIVRALYWLIYNRPTGAADIFRNWLVGEKDEVLVKVVVDGYIMARFREGAKNGYYIFDPDNNLTELKAIRQDVPSEVSDLLQIGDYNIQPQHDSYFLLADSPGDVARRLNEVCGLVIIDGTLKVANLLISRNGQAIKTSEQSIEQTKADIEAYADLEDREMALGRLERKQGHLVDTQARIKTLTGMIDTKEKLESDLAGVNDLLKAEPEVKALMAKVEERERVRDRITRLQSLIDERTRLDKELQRTEATLGELESGLHSLWDGLDVCPLCLQPMK